MAVETLGPRPTNPPPSSPAAPATPSAAAAPPASSGAASPPAVQYSDNDWGHAAQALAKNGAQASATDFQKGALWALDQQNQAAASPNDAQSRANLAGLEASLPPTTATALRSFLATAGASGASGVSSNQQTQQEAFLSNPNLPRFTQDDAGSLQAKVLMSDNGAVGAEAVGRADLAGATQASARMAQQDPAGYQQYLAAITDTGARQALDGYVKAHPDEQPGSVSAATEEQEKAFWKPPPAPSMGADPGSRGGTTSMSAILARTHQAAPQTNGWQRSAAQHDDQASAGQIVAAAANLVPTVGRALTPELGAAANAVASAAARGGAQVAAQTISQAASTTGSIAKAIDKTTGPAQPGGLNAANQSQAPHAATPPASPTASAGADANPATVADANAGANRRPAGS